MYDERIRHLETVVSYKLALNFEDDVTHFVRCAPGQKVSEAAYRVGINIPLDCREGACGTCKATCESGSYEMDDYVDDALTQEEAASRIVLTCRMSPTSDCVIRVHSTSKACLKTVVADRTAKIQRVEKLSDSSFRLRVVGQELRSLDFLPGQYANLTIPGTTTTRAYSFSSLVCDDAVDFLIRKVPGGLMSSYLDERAKEGDTIKIRGPLGSFYLRDVRRPILMLAGGTGLAPFLPMLERLRSDPLNADHPIRLVYGVTRDDDLVLADEIEAYAEAMANFSWLACVADKQRAHPHRGVVTDFISRDDVRGGDVDIYVCGPPPLVEAVNGALGRWAVVPASLYYEKFVASR